jgi:hypothetical protein
MLDAFDKGLEEAGRRARRKVAGEVCEQDIASQSLLDAWTARIIHDVSVGMLRRTYGKEFASNYSSDTKLGTLFTREGVETLDEYVKKHRIEIPARRPGG